MGKKLMLAVAMVALMAVPSFAAVQNVKVSGDITETSVIRNFGLTYQGAGMQNEVLSQVNLKVAADLTDNVSTVIKLQNERLWGTGNQTSATDAGTGIVLDTAYVSMKELLYSPLTLTVGRQPLAYGNQLIIGDGDNLTKVGAISDLTGGVNFDAIKAVLAYEPLTIDLFAARTNNGPTDTVALGTVNATNDNQNLYGINANYKMGDKMSTVVEGYMFAKIDNNARTYNATPNVKQGTTYTPGLRVSTNPIEGLNVQLEGAYQFGQVRNTGDNSMWNRDAFAVQSKVNYALPVMKNLKPVLGAAYTYLSGNKTYEGSTKTTAWDSMFQNQNVGRIYHALSLDLSNAQLATASIEVTPLKDLTAALSATGVWNAQKAAYSGAVDAAVNSSKYQGVEGDLDLTYAYTEDVKFGVSAGYFITGKTYVPSDVDGDQPTSGNKNASQVLTSASAFMARSRFTFLPGVRCFNVVAS
ncbi:MAG: alginate export family protein, partial [Candidatus Omnitrophica bacterium]|nr:alginate export family protein [Candidatus Omnitrophota bacterium]